MSAQRRWRLGAGLALGAAALGLGAYAYLHSDAFRERIKNYVVEQLAQGSGARVEVAGFGLSLHPLRLELDGLVLHGREGAGQPTLASIPRLVVEVEASTLWRRQLALQQVAMTRPQFHIYRLADGALNLPQPARPWPRRQQEARTLFDLGAQHLEMDGGELDIADQHIPLNLELAGVALRLAATTTPAQGGAPQGAAFAGTLRFEKSAVQYGGLPPQTVDTRFDFTLWPNDLRFNQIELAAAGAHLEASGWLRHFDHPQFQATYQGGLDIAAAARALGLRGARPSGQARVAGQAQWSARGWTGQGTVTLAQGHWALAPGQWRGIAAWQASRNGLVVPSFNLDGLGSGLRGSARDDGWRGLTLAGQLTRLRWAALQAALGRKALGQPWRQGLAAVDSALSGTVRLQTDARLRLRQLAAQLTLAPEAAAGRLGVGGTLDATYAAATGALTLRRLDVEVAQTRLTATGALAGGRGTLQVALRSQQLAALAPLWQPWTAGRPALGGSAQFIGTVSGALAAPTLSGHLELDQFHWNTEAADVVRAEGTLSPDRLTLTQATVIQETQSASAHGSIGLHDYRVVPASVLAAALAVQGVSLERLQQAAGVHDALSGTLNATGTLGGTWAQPQGRGHVALARTRWRGQPIQSVTADFQLQNGHFSSSNLALALAKTRIHGSFALGWNDHSYQVNVASDGVQLSEVALLQSSRLAVSGQARFQLSGSGRWEAPQAELVLTTSGLQGAGESLGDLGARVQLAQGRAQFQLADILPNGSFNLTGSVGIAAPYLLDARLQLRDYDFDAWLRRFTPAQLSGHSQVSGSATVQGPLAQPDQLQAQIAFDPVEVALSGLVIHNQGPIQLQASQRRLTLLPAHIVAQDTDFTLAGAALLGSNLRAPVRLEGQLAGHINLALIQSLHPETHASGQVTVDAHLGGTAAAPRVQGTLRIANGSLAEANLPIGLDNIQGQLQLNGQRLEIQQLTADTGGGTLALSGFAARSGGGASYDLQATGQNLRLRYQGISTTGDLKLRLSGTAGGALLQGTAQLNRVGLDRDFDLAVFIARTQATPAPPNPDSLLNKVRMDIHLVTGPQVVVATNLAHLQLQADLRLGGSLAQPSVLGRASASEGQLLFAGNEYQVTKAQVQFVNPFSIEPLLDVGLSTTVQQYDVTLNISGPADKLAITYRSDPPLSSSDVVALLATGAPTQATSTLSGANNFAPSEQLLGQALDNLVAGRLQRLFGITQVQVNPDTGDLGPTGSGGTVTVQQQVSRNLKLTYTQNLSSSSQDIIQVDWTISRSLGITLNRDQFGLYGLKFTLRQRAR